MNLDVPLPVPVIFLHALFGWVAWCRDPLPAGQPAATGLGNAHRARRGRPPRPDHGGALDPRLPHRRQSGKGVIRTAAVPPERNFPLSVVITHGVLAVITVVLVLFTAFGAGVI